MGVGVEAKSVTTRHGSTLGQSKRSRDSVTAGKW